MIRVLRLPPPAGCLGNCAQALPPRSALGDFKCTCQQHTFQNDRRIRHWKTWWWSLPSFCSPVDWNWTISGGLRRAIWIHVLHLWSSTMSSGKRSTFSSIVERTRWKVSCVTRESLITDLVQQWQSWFCKEQKMNMENTSSAKVFQGTPVTKMPQPHHWTITQGKGTEDSTHRHFARTVRALH